jgi:hypothetical protein
MMFKILILLSIIVVVVNGICPAPSPARLTGFKFVGKGGTCNGTYPDCTLCCKNFLSCMASTNVNVTGSTCVETQYVFFLLLCSPSQKKSLHYSIMAVDY